MMLSRRAGETIVERDSSGKEPPREIWKFDQGERMEGQKWKS